MRATVYHVPDRLAYSFAFMLLEAARAYVIDHVVVDGDTGCWVWANCGDGRYGHAYFLGMRFKAHRLAFLAFRGRIPRGYVVDHERCDRTLCVAPGHLQACTQSRNIGRCFEIGRGRSPFIKKGIV